MAAPMKNNAGDPNMSSGELSDTSEEIDITSPFFNPVSALYAEQVPLPFHIAKDVKLFNNVAEFENAYRKNPDQVVNIQATKPKHTRSDVTKDAVTKSTILKEKAVSEEDENAKRMRELRLMRRNRNVLTRMERYERGPYNYLLRCVKEQHFVAVWTRGAVDVRGVCKGFIIAFDKHFNLAMMDVDEIYRPPVIRPRTKKKQETSKIKVKDEKQTEESCSSEESVSDNDTMHSEKSVDLNNENEGTKNKKSSPDIKTEVTCTDKVEDNIIEMTKNLELRETTEKSNVEDKTCGKGDNKSHMKETAKSDVAHSKGDNKKSGIKETANETVKTRDKGDNVKSLMKETSKSQVAHDKGDNKKSGIKETAKSQIKTCDEGDNVNTHVSETVKSEINTGDKGDSVTMSDSDTAKSDNTTDKISHKETFHEDLSERDRLVIGFNEFMGLKNSDVKLIKRHVNQMFIRGDNVVSIAILT